MVQPLGKEDNSSSKNKNRTTVWAINFTSGYIPKMTEIRELKSYIYTKLTAALVKSQKVKATQVLTDRWMNKQNVCVCTHTME